MSLSSFFKLRSHREVWGLAWPIILSNSSVPLLGAVDTAVVGHLPEAHYLGAVAIGAMIFSFLYWGFGFLRMGTTGFVALAAGEKDADEIRAIMGRAILLSVAISILILLMQGPVLWLALSLIEGTGDVEAGARDYFLIRIWGAPAVLVNYALMGFFIGTKNTRAALIIQIFMNSLNIALDLLFVIGFGWAVSGVAAATVISEMAAVILAVIIMRGQLTIIGGKWIRTTLLSGNKLMKLLSINFDIFVRTILLIFAFAYFTVEAAKKGEVTLAAVAVLMNFMHFIAFGLDGFAFAAEGMVGSAIGSKQSRQLREIVIVSSFWALIVSVAYALSYYVFGHAIIDILTSLPEVRAYAYEYLPWLVLAPLISIWSYQFDGIFIGALQSKELRNGMLISFIGYMISIHLFNAIWGVHGMWAALMLFMALRAITLAAVYPRVEKAASA